MSKTINAVFAMIFLVLGATSVYGDISGTLNGSWEIVYLLLVFVGLYWVVRVNG